jgi:hypothetical protein
VVVVVERSAGLGLIVVVTTVEIGWPGAFPAAGGAGTSIKR